MQGEFQPQRLRDALRGRLLLALGLAQQGLWQPCRPGYPSDAPLRFRAWQPQRSFCLRTMIRAESLQGERAGLGEASGWGLTLLRVRLQGLGA